MPKEVADGETWERAGMRFCYGRATYEDWLMYRSGSATKLARHPSEQK